MAGRESKGQVEVSKGGVTGLDLGQDWAVVLGVRGTDPEGQARQSTL